MALTTYTELKASVADWLNRTDLTTQIPDFISMFESNVERKLRVRQMLLRARTNPVADEAYENLPGDYLEMKTLHFNSNPICVPKFRTPAWLRAYRRSTASTTGTPQFFAIEGSQILFDVTPADVELEILYYQKIPRLSGSQASNWLLDEAPDIYLYGTLMGTAPFLKDDERVGVWGTLYERAVADLSAQDARSEVNGPPLSRTPRRAIG